MVLNVVNKNVLFCMGGLASANKQAFEHICDFGVLISDLFPAVPLVENPAYGPACLDHRHAI